MLSNTSWPNVMENIVVNELWTKWKTVFISVVDKFALTRSKCVKKKTLGWINSEITNLMAK